MSRKKPGRPPLFQSPEVDLLMDCQDDGLSTYQRDAYRKAMQLHKLSVEAVTKAQKGCIDSNSETDSATGVTTITAVFRVAAPPKPPPPPPAPVPILPILTPITEVYPVLSANLFTASPIFVGPAAIVSQPAPPTKVVSPAGNALPMISLIMTIMILLSDHAMKFPPLKLPCPL